MNSDYLVGKVLENRYEIVEMIGSGGMATVYKAKCRVLNRYVAIKVLKDALKYDAEVVKKFNAEARASAGLSHPNIVQVYDVSEKGELDYIVMEYVDGITLKEYIAKMGNLDYREACSFAIQIGRALECAHKNHIIHRDIKPHNVLMTRDGVLKVTDFGIAQAASSETIVAGHNNMGSVHYISPEQGRGGYIDERSDIYSLGVVLYEMLTGKLPFDGGNPVSIAMMKLEKEPQDCRIVNPTIPDNVGKVTMKAISKEQHLRYQSAQEMVSDLESIVGNTRASIEREETDDIYKTNRIADKETKELYYMRKEKSRHKENNGKVTMTIFLILLGLIIGVGTYFYMAGGRQEYQVPDLTNMTLEEAEESLEKIGLKLSEDIEYEESEEVDEDLIISQKPGANQYVKKNRKIKVVVSLGSETELIKVPDVSDITFEDAQVQLEKLGLKCKKIEKFEDGKEIGIVVSQSPKKNTEVPEGYTIMLYVSAEDENEQVVVPKITGYTETQAKAMLEEVGLVVGSVDKASSNSQQGVIIAQTPAAKTGVVKGSSVNITVSSGNETEEKPVQMQKKTFTITIPEDANDTVRVKVVANGKVIHDKNHQKSEGTVDIEVQSSKDASVQAYIDGNLVVDKVISFN